MKRNKLFTLLAVLLCASVTTTIFAGAPGAGDVGNNVEPSNQADVNNPVAYVINAYSLSTPYATFADAVAAWTSGTTLQLLADVEVSSSIVLDSKGSISLDLNGYGIKYTGSVGSVFELASTQLTLSDSNPTASHKYTVANAVEGAGLATINDELSSGYTFLYGGYITGGKGRVGVGYYDEEIGGGAFILYSSDASLTMEAGTLIGNQSNENGGAILIYSGTVTLNGGAIQNNYSAKYGGGVSVRAGSTLNLYGGQIIYNTATYNGGGVFTDITMGSLQLNMHGHPEVRFNYVGTQRENVYLANSYDGHVKINIDGELTDYYSMSPTVGITIENKSAGSHVVTYGFRQNGGHYEGYEYEYPNSPDYYFFSDYPFFYVNWEPGGYGYSNEVALTFQKATLPAPSGVVKVNGLVYNGTSQVLVDASGVVAPANSVIKYSYNRTADDYVEALPAKTDAGSWTVYYRAYPAPGYEDLYNKSTYASVSSCAIAKATASITAAPTAKTGLTYTGSPQQLVNPGTVSGGTMKYSVNGTSNYQAEIPTGVIGSFRVYYVLDGGTNYTSDMSVQYVDVLIDGPHVYDNADPSTTLSGMLYNNDMSLTVHRTIYADGWYNTICLPFNMSASQIASSPLVGYETLKAMRAAKVSGAGQNLSIDIMVEDVTEIEAGVPYLISYVKGHGDIVNPTFNGIEVTTTSPGYVYKDGVTFQGMFAPEHIITYAENSSSQDYLFLGENNVLTWPNDDGSDMRGFRAYFIIDRNTITPMMAPKGTRARIMNAPQQATALDNIQDSNVPGTKIIENGVLYIIRGEHMYNAQGNLVK